MTLINPKTGAVSLDPFVWHGQTLRLTGTFKTERGWEHDVKNETTGEVKRKGHGWIVSVNAKLSQVNKP